MKFSLLIVNYNTESYIEKLLYSLHSQSMPASDYEIIISNNVKNDNLEKMIMNNEFHKTFLLRTLTMPDNLGFGRGMNAAADLAIAEHLLIINPDVLMTDQNYLSSMYDFILEKPNYGVISSQIVNDNGRDGCDHYSYQFHETFGLDSGISWIEGSLMFIRKETFASIDGFDPDFFMYCEDVDLCYRIRKNGLELIKNNSLSVYHKGGSSEPNKDYAFYHRWYKSQILFMHKHYNKEQFDEFIKELSKKFRIKKYRYRALSIFSKSYKHKVLRTQVMLDVIGKTINESADWLY
ncbi:glycosyltransferase family 2 protein [Psychrobacter sp. APC 3350]|uniref:glycosyltransferase family 2 protein n=1 Tax=Psychrobacter sp. APC 3350 TaxID=3035195 RepID=UPI0025B4032F|nr:glycosyltransferase family 2 protein [Psychrobacter sp. APC 3350]MDN3454638.1 glycosyltransferase family 2 protein [Psychrobacter sp. APC 3350]